MAAELFEYDDRTFKFEYGDGKASIEILEGDYYRPLSEGVFVEASAPAELRKAAENRARQYCSSNPRSLKFRCDRSGLLYNTELVPTGKASDVWQLRRFAPCTTCGSEHRVFVL